MRRVLEEQADNTQENIGYSLAMLAERGMDPAAAIAVVTSDYHLCRASMYMTGNMVPVAAALPVRYLPLTANYYIREAFGVAEAVVFGKRRENMPYTLCVYYSRTGNTES